MITVMRKSIKEAITSTVVDMIEADLKVSDELMEDMKIAKIVEDRKDSKTIDFEKLLEKNGISYDDL